MAPSETIYAALLATVAASQGIVTASRRWKMYSDVSPAMMPAVYIKEPERIYEQNLGVPPRVKLHATLCLYVYSDVSADPSATPATQLNNLIDSVLASLAPDNSATQALTFSGLVTYARIASGRSIITDEGILDPYGVAIIPIEILATI